jgi:hypothetical protein
MLEISIVQVLYYLIVGGLFRSDWKDGRLVPHWVYPVQDTCARRFVHGVWNVGIERDGVLEVKELDFY